MITNAKIETLEKALREVNKRFKGNVAFNRIPESIGKKFRFTLKVKYSQAPGHRLGFHRTSTGKQRRLASACWHVHGYFFEEVFKIEPEAFIQAGDKRITAYTGNWEDRNIGSIMNPMYFSEACECGL